MKTCTAGYSLTYVTALVRLVPCDITLRQTAQKMSFLEQPLRRTSEKTLVPTVPVMLLVRAALSLNIHSVNVFTEQRPSLLAPQFRLLADI
jgi:hypothetical protein